MSEFKVTFKRTEAFNSTIVIDAQTADEARSKADVLSCEGAIEFDYFKESDLIDEYILDVEKVD
ncbi:MAG: hypothetical protein ACYCQI_15780 [Gammaproteobacteria bacterium]